MAANEISQVGITTEIERTYLAKELPHDLTDCKYTDLIDIYIPASMEHPHLRLRKIGSVCELTKKMPYTTADSSIQQEVTIPLEVEEYDELATVNGKHVQKRRYYFPYNGQIAEIDVFMGDLAGLVLVDFEFPSKEVMDAFVQPDFCLAEVTQEYFTAGGKLAGKSFADIKPDLERYQYRPLSVQG